MKMKMEKIQKQKKKKSDEAYKKFLDYTKDLKSEKFNFYYKTQLKEYFENDEQFEVFLEKLREKLPCVFRINPSNSFYKQFKQMLEDPNFLFSFTKSTDDSSLKNEQDNSGKQLEPGSESEVKEEIKMEQQKINTIENIKISPFNLTNIPKLNNMIYNINIPRFELKRNSALSKFHSFIQKSVDSGLISRQEAVSMIPPILMEVVPGESVFDTCAAPGSKTAQLLEEFYRDFDFLNPTSILNDSGIVLANDNNFNRAYMMSHQLKRLNTSGMMIISHDAQFFPTIFKENDERYLFDKLLCDVPCSSDAVLRKLPHKWKIWSPRDSFSLHKLQLQILKRGISLLKVGGRLVYSTCSLNPIENEAVVCEIMRNYGECLEIVDMKGYFEGSHIKTRPGLTSWKILTENKENPKELLEIVSKLDPLYEKNKMFIDESCFPEEEETCKNLFKLQNCIRLFPHDNDTSGFFITIFKKLSPISYGSDKVRRPDKLVNQDKGVYFMEEFPEILSSIQEYYGLRQDFPFKQLVTHSKIQKRLQFVSKGVYNLLKSDSRNQLKIMAVGVKLFSVNKKTLDHSGQEKCIYRVCQDGLIYLIPFMRKRVFFCGLEFLIRLIKSVDLKHSDVENSELKAILSETSTGCVVLIVLKEFENIKFTQQEIFDMEQEKYLEFLRENYLDALCCYNSPFRISTMINKEHHHVFNMKYNI